MESPWTIMFGFFLSSVGALTLLLINRVTSDVRDIRNSFQQVSLEVTRLAEWSKQHTVADERAAADLARRLERIENWRRETHPSAENHRK